MSAIGTFRAKSDVYKSVYLFNLMYILYNHMVNKYHIQFVSISRFSNPFVIALIIVRRGKYYLLESRKSHFLFKILPVLLPFHLVYTYVVLSFAILRCELIGQSKTVCLSFVKLSLLTCEYEMSMCDCKFLSSYNKTYIHKVA